MPDPRLDSFAKLLGQHGYGLQYAVLRELERASREEQLRWVFEVAEFPVSVRGRDTRVDFVLRHVDKPLYVVVECKRANPALSDWCFLRAPYTYRDQRREGVFVDRMTWEDNRRLRFVEVAELLYTSDAYHIGLELKTNAAGDDVGRGRGELDHAATQVMLGVNGLIESFARSKVRANSQRYLIPIVVTTANLWGSDTDLAAADLETSVISRERISLLPKTWIAYQYPTSESIKHETARRFPLSPDLVATFAGEYLRTVQFVRPQHLPGLLRLISDAGTA